MDGKNTLRVRLTLGIAFSLMGFSFSVTQSLLMREMLVSFAGNELSIGLMLGSWLLLEAAGSALLGRVAARMGHGVHPYARLQILFAILLVPVLYVAFGMRHLLGGVAGLGYGLPLIFAASLLLLIPLGIVDGAMFTVGCQVDDTLRRGGVRTVGRVYVLEAMGGIVGGLVFTYLFVPYLHSVQTALALIVLNLGSALSLMLLAGTTAPGVREGSVWRSAGTGGLTFSLVLCLFLLLSPWAGRIQHRLAAWRWHTYDLAFDGNSVYGNVAAIRQGEQYTFLANGVPILTSPVPDVATVEEMVHLPLLFVPKPRRALVLSGGLGGVIRELLKYPLEQVDYAELDPLLIEAVASLPTPLTEAELNDPRLHIQRVDGRLLVRRLAADKPSAKSYDLVLVNLPYPSTLQLNRFYTVEFWSLVRGLLTDDGVVVCHAPGSLTYLSPAMRALHAALHETLAEVFPHVRPIPGDVTLWLASPSPALTLTETEELVARWDSRGVPSNLITSFHIRYKLDARWLTWFWGSLQEGRPAPANRDLRPSGLLYGLAYWNELFSPGLAPYFQLLGQLELSALLAPAILVALIGLVALWLRRPARAWPVAVAIGATGFGGMTANLLVIFVFQSLHGYVYQLIGLLTTAFMAGLSLGGWVMTRAGHAAAPQRNRHRLLMLELAALLFWLALPWALTGLHRGMDWGTISAVVGPALLALNALAGFLVGAQFPVANEIYLRDHPGLSGTAGVLYAADLVGGCLGALLISVALLPALGIVQTCLLVAVFKAGTFVLLIIARRSSPATR